MTGDLCALQSTCMNGEPTLRPTVSTSRSEWEENVLNHRYWEAKGITFELLWAPRTNYGRACKSTLLHTHLRLNRSAC